MLIYQRVPKIFAVNPWDLWKEGCLLFTQLPDSKPASKPSKIPGFWFGKTNLHGWKNIYQHHQVVFVGWTSCSFNFFFLKSCICSLGSGSECLETIEKSSGRLSVTIVFPVWAVNISTFKVQLTCVGPCRQTTARRSRRRRRPRSVMSLKVLVLVVFLVESKYHLESYHPSETIKFTSWRVIKQCPWTGL